MENISEQQRLELCQKLDADLNNFIKEAASKPKASLPEDSRSVDEIYEVNIFAIYTT